MTKTPLLVALTFDTDADQFDPSVARAADEPEIAWRGVAEGIPQIVDVARSFRDSHGATARCSWFVRVDNQIQEVFGDSGYLLDTFRSMWDRCIQAGDEIAWHPHLYRREGAAWVQEKDDARLEVAMRASFAAFAPRGLRPRAARIGEAYCSNGIMAVLDDLGFRADSTAMPGRVRKDGDRSLDWSGTPHEPYRPSIDDYRRPGSPSRKLVEIPMSLVPVRADYDREPFSRYIDLSFHPRALRDGIEAYVARGELLVAMTHPSGVLSDLMTKSHGLISFSIDGFQENLQTIVDATAKAGRELRFVTIGEAIDWAERRLGAHAA